LLPVACCAVARAQQSLPAIGELFAADGNAKLVQPAGAGMSVVSGSELSAGVAPARLKLYRGGEVRICPRSGLSVNSGRYGLMFAMGSGMVEIDYSLVQRGADFLLTPDFSIQLAGPGKYHFALGANKQGDTCVKSLPGNSAPIQLSELLGSATYRMRPQDSVSFRGGKINGNTPLKVDEACGCPAPEPAIEATVDNPAETKPPSTPQPQIAPTAPVAVPARTASEPIPADRPGQVHVQVDTPFVFSAKDATSVKPYSVAKLRISSLPNVFFVQETVDPVVLEERPPVVSVREEAPAQASATPPERSPKKKEKKGFFGKLKGLFGGMFGR
jgi:hypothetical protein